MHCSLVNSKCGRISLLDRRIQVESYPDVLYSMIGGQVWVIVRNEVHARSVVHPSVKTGEVNVEDSRLSLVED